MKVTMLVLALGSFLAYAVACIPAPGTSSDGGVAPVIEQAVVDGWECAMKKYEDNANVDWQTVVEKCGMGSATEVAVKILLAKQAAHLVFAARIAKGAK